MFINRRNLFNAILILGIFSSCTNQKNISNKISNNCNAKEESIKILKEESGIFHFDQNGRAVISIHTPGTIDEVSKYFICNPPSELPKVNTEVIFSGKVRSSKEKVYIGGVTNYELEIDDLKF